MTTPPHVLSIKVAVRPPWPGGAERTGAEWAHELRAGGVRVTEVGLAAPGRPALREPGRRELRIPMPYWPHDQSGRSDRPRLLKAVWHVLNLVHPWSLVRLLWLVRRERPDLLMVDNITGWSAAPYLVARLLGVPLVSTVHDYGLICTRASLYRESVCRRTCLSCRPRSLVSHALWRPQEIVTVSEALWSEIHRRAPRLGRSARRTVVAPTIDRARAPVATLHRPARTIGYLGRLDAAKGVEDLLAAADGLPVTVLVGGPLDTPYADQLVATYGGPAVRFLGEVEQADFLATIDVLVVPSRWLEPFGRVVVEGLLAGRYVVAADRPGLREAAARAQGDVAGVEFYPAGDVPALRAILTSLSSSPAATRPGSGASWEEPVLPAERSVLDVIKAALS